MQPIGQGGTAQAGRPAATMGLIAAILYALGIFLPYVSGGGDSASLADGGGEVYAMYLLPAVVGAVAAVMAMQGKQIAAAVAGGVAVGMLGFTVLLLAIVFRLVDSFGDFGDIGYGVGFFAHAGAVVLSVLGGLSALGGRRGGAAVNPAVATFAAISFAGVPLAILLPEDGFSVFDIGDGVLEGAMFVFALASPLLAVIGALSRSRTGMAVASGVSIGHLGVVVGMAVQKQNQGDQLLSGFSVSHEGLYSFSVVASVILCAVGVLGTAAASGGVAAGGSAAGSQWAADPFGRHELRFYNGMEWTSAVSDAGVVGMDAPVAQAPEVPPRPAAPVTPVSPFAAPGSVAPPPAPGLFESPSSAVAAGEPSPPPSSTRLCPNGHPNLGSSMFCTSCGARL